MKYTAKVSGKKLEWPSVHEASEVASESDGTGWSFERRPGGWVIAVRGAERVRFHYTRVKQQFWAKINSVHASSDSQSHTTDHLDVYGERISVNRAGAAGDANSDFVAQFPGKIRKVMVVADQVVEEGTPLLMIEAMKMEFAIKATQKGKIKKILVEEGQVLTPGQKLLDFEVA